MILAGLLIGLGMVQLASGPMSQTSRFSLELLILLIHQLVGPMLMALLALALLLPRWMARIELAGQVSWKHTESTPVRQYTQGGGTSEQRPRVKGESIAQ